MDQPGRRNTARPGSAGSSAFGSAGECHDRDADQRGDVDYSEDAQQQQSGVPSSAGTSPTNMIRPNASRRKRSRCRRRRVR